MEVKLSIIIPTSNEKVGCHLIRMASEYPQNLPIEFIVVDTGSATAVLDKLKRPDFRLFPVTGLNRSQKLNYGLKQAKAPFIVFHHPRSLINQAGLKYLALYNDDLSWGGFRHRFDSNGLGLAWTSWYSNYLRPKLFNVVYLDHCIFFRKNLLSNEIPNIPIFEDTEISKILMKSGKPQILPYISETSAIRFKTKGFVRQALLNQLLKLGYHSGWSNKK